MLKDFVHFVDVVFDFSSFANVLPVCARDVITGLQFLNRSGIAHRDLKPGNIFDSNSSLSFLRFTEKKRVKSMGINLSPQRRNIIKKETKQGPISLRKRFRGPKKVIQRVVYHHDGNQNDYPNYGK